MTQILTIDDIRIDHRFHVGFIWECERCKDILHEAKTIGEIMHTAMLWYDNSHTALTVKIQKAAEYYEKKYGRKPDLVLVHPSMMDNAKPILVGKLTVHPYRPVLPGHIWIGIEDKS